MSGSASPVKYTCVAKNEGGVSKGNVTLVYSETVATYLDNRDISMLLVTGLVAGVMVFLAIGSAVICFVMHRKHSRRNTRHHHLPHNQGIHTIFKNMLIYFNISLNFYHGYLDYEVGDDV